MPFSNRVSTWALLTIAGISIWRRISRRRSIQEKLHACCKKGSFLMQWYTLLTIAMLLFVVGSNIEYFREYATHAQATTDKTLRDIYGEEGQAQLLEDKLNITTFEEVKDVLTIPVWVQIVNGLGQVCGVFTIAIVIYQMWAQFILPCRTAAQQNPIWNTHDWLLPKRLAQDRNRSVNSKATSETSDTMDKAWQQQFTSTSPFSVKVAEFAGGEPSEVTDLYPNMELSDFCEKVAAQVGIPAFAVRLLHGSRLLHMSCLGESLASTGVKPGSTLTLVKQFGWAKPDLRMLSELQGQPMKQPRKEMLCSDMPFDLEKCQAQRRHHRNKLLEQKQHHKQCLQQRQQQQQQQH